MLSDNDWEKINSNQAIGKKMNIVIEILLLIGLIRYLNIGEPTSNWIIIVYILSKFTWLVFSAFVKAFAEIVKKWIEEMD